MRVSKGYPISKGKISATAPSKSVSQRAKRALKNCILADGNRLNSTINMSLMLTL